MEMFVAHARPIILLYDQIFATTDCFSCCGPYARLCLNAVILFDLTGNCRRWQRRKNADIGPYI